MILSFSKLGILSFEFEIYSFKILYLVKINLEIIQLLFLSLENYITIDFFVTKLMHYFAKNLTVRYFIFSQLIFIINNKH